MACLFPVVDEPSRTLVELMKTYKIHFVGGKRTLDETIRGYDLTWAMYIIFVFLVNIIALRFRPKSSLILTWINLVNVILWGVCLVVSLIFWSIPQQVLFGLLSLFFILAYFHKPKKPKPNDTKIAIIGAGVAGLTSAYQLKKKGYNHVVVFEKDAKVGGKCVSFEYNFDAFDLGGHEMLAGYKDVMDMASEVGAPTKTSITPLVYDRENKKYLNFTQSSLVSGYSKMQVLWACIRYWWMAKFRYRHFARPELSFKDMPAELMVPLDEWLEKKNLKPISSILEFVIKVQGYGDTTAAYFVKFMSPANWSSLILSGIGLTKKWPRVFVEGMQNFWERIALQVQVKTSTPITKIVRGEDGAPSNIQIWTEGSEEPLYFDKLIICTPLDLPAIHYLDIESYEKELFEQIETVPFVTTACIVQGLPAGVVATIPPNNIAAGEYTGYIKDYKRDDLAIFFSVAADGHDGEYIVKKIKKVLSDIPPYEGKQPELKKVHIQRAWKFFPHVDQEAQKDGFYVQLESLQGKRDTFYANSLFSFEIVGNTTAYAKALIEKHF